MRKDESNSGVKLDFDLFTPIVHMSSVESPLLLIAGQRSIPEQGVYQLKISLSHEFKTWVDCMIMDNVIIPKFVVTKKLQ